MISVQELSFTLNGKILIEPLSFNVRRGEVVGLIGPNGSGKSTLLRLLAGISRPSNGEILLNGRCIHSQPRDAVARQLAHVAQQAETHDRIHVRDAVELGRTPWLSLLNPWSERDDAIVDQAMQVLNIQHLQHRVWQTLSGGERQRVHLARALAQQPEVLLFDEPSNHLDIQNQLAILELIATLEATIVVALHDLNHATACDRVIMMCSGNMVAMGATEEVLTPENIKRVFGVNVRMLYHDDIKRPVFYFY